MPPDAPDPMIIASYIFCFAKEPSCSGKRFGRAEHTGLTECPLSDILFLIRFKFQPSAAMPDAFSTGVRYTIRKYVDAPDFITAPASIP